ncbi:unnamed protein product, partial [Oppiella nova]
MLRISPYLAGTQSQDNPEQRDQTFRLESQSQGYGNGAKKFNGPIFDPDIIGRWVHVLTMPQLIESRGFQSETHTVTTGDGYILQVFRMVNPQLPNSGRQLRHRPVILWHGVAVTSDSWLFSTEGSIDSRGVYNENNDVFNDCERTVTSTLAYTLSACGYDVWLANTRGTHYSQGHMQVSYIGHSLGTAQMFVLLSLVPDFERFIRPYIALAPIAYLGNIESIGRLGVPLEPILKTFPGPLGIPVPIAQLIVPIDAAHSGASVSTWVYGHLAQLVVNKCFRRFDYGIRENIRRYGQSQPPSYPLCNITSKNIALFRGLNDLLADTMDVSLLVQDLTVPLLDNYIVPDPKWNHQDFQLGVNQGYISRGFNYWSKQGIPGPTPLPIVGNYFNSFFMA